MSDLPALTYGGTEGHNQSSGSIDRATDPDALSKAARSQRLILAHLAQVGERGTTCHEAEPVVMLTHETYTGSRANLHKAGRVVRLTEKRERRGVYVLPEHVAGRDIEPFKPNRSRRDAPPEEVVGAADRTLAWVTMSEPTGMIVTAPDYDDLRTIIDYAKGTQ